MHDIIKRTNERFLKIVTEKNGIMVERLIWLSFLTMTLTPPKRLFNNKSGKTVLYKDNVNDIKEKGYVAISHVWGDQKKYKPEQIGIGGINWEVPLSDSNKISYVRDLMLDLKKEYCWFDVLCMPQDKQDEINLEIPFMGDYYSGADITLVLTTGDYPVSKDYKTWYNMVTDAMNSTGLTDEDREWMREYYSKGDKNGLLNFSKEQWFTRVWTFQEAVLSKDIVLIYKDSYIYLSDTIKRLQYMDDINMLYSYWMFKGSRDDLAFMGYTRRQCSDGVQTLASVLQTSASRKCYKPQDNFYGMLGILGYSDFKVDYDINLEDLNKSIAKHAYSKGDLSWMSICGNIGTGFIQPMHGEFNRIGYNWQEDTPGSCGITFHDKTLGVNAMMLATVVSCEKSPKFAETPDFHVWSATIFRNWGFVDNQMISTFSNFVRLDSGLVEMACVYIKRIIEGMGLHDIGKEIASLFPHDTTRITHMISAIVPHIIPDDATIVKANLYGTEVTFPLIISGNAAIGDRLMLVRLHDEITSFGIVASGNKRTGVFIYRRVDMPQHEIPNYYRPHEFLL